ncbi:MAG TPA: serine/threonine-protein kinase [Kofleriaceae bacterium]|nr:serine/threonine-protein kinase [Kofleriaceae bacterium]
MYAARECQLGRMVAIKFITDARARERFVREAQALARCQHPNIVSLFRVGRTGAGPYLVCELIAGRRLDEAQPSTWQQVVSIAIGLARAIAATHARGVIHRDIKPSNVMISDDGVVKLLDFGLAVIHDDGEPREDTTIFAGTPRYMAPELWCGTRASPRTDLYAFGLVVRDLLDTLPDDTELPASLVQIVDDCTRSNPERRPVSAELVHDHLQCLAVRFAPTHVPAPLVEEEPSLTTLRFVLGDLVTEDVPRAPAHDLRRTGS